MDCTALNADPTYLAHLEGIKQVPEDDVRRLVLADWLDDTAGTAKACSGTHVHAGKAGYEYHGVVHTTNPNKPHHHCDDKCWVSDGRAERAEFIRVQVAVEGAPLKRHNQDLSFRSWESLRKREVELFQAVGYNYPLPGPCVPNLDGKVGRPGPHAVFRRGFVDEVLCTASEWVGYKCTHCQGHRVVAAGQHWDDNSDCRHCTGTGKSDPIGPPLVTAHPVTKVVLTDREPNRGEPSWWGPLNGFPYTWATQRPAGGLAEPHLLPTDLFECLPLDPDYRKLVPTHVIKGSSVMWYKSDQDAIAALSVACLRWAKKQRKRGLAPAAV